MCNHYFEVYKNVRSQIGFEYDQIGNRLNWLLISQSFLFGALIINLSSIVNLASPIALNVLTNGPKLLWHDVFGAVDIIHKWSLFFPILPLLGLLVSVAVLCGVLGAILRIFVWKSKESDLIEKLESCRNSYRYSVIKTKQLLHYLGLVPIIFIPVSFVVIWFFIIFPNLFKFDFFSYPVGYIEVVATIFLFILACGFGIFYSVICINSENCLMTKIIEIIGYKIKNCKPILFIIATISILFLLFILIKYFKFGIFLLITFALSFFIFYVIAYLSIKDNNKS